MARKMPGKETGENSKNKKRTYSTFSGTLRLIDENQSIQIMKRIMTILIALAALTACEKTDTNDFSETMLPGTRWEGMLTTANGATSTSSDVNLTFRNASQGSASVRNFSTQKMETYQMTYSVTGKTITFECPVINGIWNVKEYNSTERTMVLKDRNNTLALTQR